MIISPMLLFKIISQHIIDSTQLPPHKALTTNFKNSDIEIRSSWSGNDLKIICKNIKGKVEIIPKDKKILTPQEGGKIILPGQERK